MARGAEGTSDGGIFKRISTTFGGSGSHNSTSGGAEQKTPLAASKPGMDTMDSGSALCTTSVNSSIPAQPNAAGRDSNTPSPSPSGTIGTVWANVGSPLLNTLPLGSLWRGQKNSDELGGYFGLPAKETFLDDYNCALRKRVLLQGRLYVFDHYVCFSSFVFGFAKKVVIPLENVTAVKKRTHLRFPNSIKIEALNNGVPENYFFTSFLSREDAFTLINNCWEQTCWHRRSSLTEPPEGRDVDSGDQADDNGEGTLEGGHQHVEGRSSGGEDSFKMWQDRSSAGGAGVNGASGRMLLPSTSRRTSAADMALRNQGAPPRRARTTQEHEDEEEEECGEGVWSCVVDAAVPAIASDARTVVTAIMDGTPKLLFDLLFADNSHLLEDFLESQGNRRINLGNWTRDAQLGLVRDMQFISPIKGAFASWNVPTTQCLQSHRFRRFPGDYLVFESSQTMTDIPYGDCFTVDVRWDVAPIINGVAMKPGSGTASTADIARAGSSPFAGSAAAAAIMRAQSGSQGSEVPQVQVTISVKTPFSRRCIFKRVIESGSQKQVKEQYSQLLEQLRVNMAQAWQEKQPVNLGGHGSLPHVASFAANLQNGGASGTSGMGSMAEDMSNGHALPGSLSNMTSRPRGMSNLNMGQTSFMDSNHVRDGTTPHGRASTPSGRVSPLGSRQGQGKLSNIQDGFWVFLDNLKLLAKMDWWQGNSQGGIISVQTWLSLFVLGVQLLLLFSTWRAASRVSHLSSVNHHHQPDGVGAGVGDGVGDGLVASSKQVWAQRATLLQLELDAMQQYVAAVSQQLQVALNRASE